MEVGPTTHYIMAACGGRGHANVARAGCSPRGNARPGSMRQSPGREFTRTCWFSGNGRENSPRASPSRTNLEPFCRRDRGRAPGAGAFEWRRRGSGEGAFRSIRFAGDDAGPRRHCAPEDEMLRALGNQKLVGGRTDRGAGTSRYNPGWHTALDLTNMLAVSKPSPVPRSNARRAGERISAMIFPTKRRLRQGEHVVWKGRTARCGSGASLSPDARELSGSLRRTVMR